MRRMRKHQARSMEIGLQLMRVLCVSMRESESSERRRAGDAWAHGGEEGRGKLRKAGGRSTRPVSPGWPNGETRLRVMPQSLLAFGLTERTRGTETSQYPEEEKSIIEIT